MESPGYIFPNYQQQNYNDSKGNVKGGVVIDDVRVGGGCKRMDDVVRVSMQGEKGKHRGRNWKV